MTDDKNITIELPLSCHQFFQKLAVRGRRLPNAVANIRNINGAF